MVIIVFLVPESFIQSLQSASSNKPRKCPMSKSEAGFIHELIKSHGTDFTVGLKISGIFSVTSALCLCLMSMESSQIN